MHTLSFLRVPRLRRQERRNLVNGLLFISLWLIGFLLFTIYPILASAYYSFMRYDIIRPPKFVGLANYAEIFFADDTFRVVLANTLYLVVIGVPITVAVAFLLATLLNLKMRFRSLFRTIFFIPAIVPAVAAAMVWLWIYNPRLWPDQLISGVTRHPGDPLAVQSRAGQAFYHHYSLLGPGQRHRHLSGGASGRAPFPLRCSDR